MAKVRIRIETSKKDNQIETSAYSVHYHQIEVEARPIGRAWEDTEFVDRLNLSDLSPDYQAVARAQREILGKDYKLTTIVTEMS